MANVFDSTGLQVSTREEWLTYFTERFQTIYGPDINLDSDTPDGQLIGTILQVILDLQDLMVAINNNFNPDTAIGNTLDQRVAINGIQRQAGTYTITPITIVNNQSINLYGIDQEDQDIYTVEDNAGNRWLLQETVLGVAAGTHSYDFRAELPGAQLTIPNTITIPVTIVLGVVSVNNPTTYTTLGINEETDAALKIRRQISVSLASQGYLAGLLAALENINGVTSAYVYENNTAITDSDGVPGHSIWVIMAGTGAAADIAQAIYVKRNAGCGMFGSESYVITQVDDSFFTVYWDNVLTRNLFIKFTATSINGTNLPNIQTIREDLPADFVPTVFQEVNINTLATDVQVIDSNCLVTSAGFSTGESQTFTLSGIATTGTFKVSYNGNLSATINWNDAIGTIQTKVQGITGLSSATVTGSIASQSLVFNLANIGGVEALLFATNNSLFAGPTPITFSYDASYQNVLTPSSKQFQFLVSSDNIIITAMQLLPVTSQVSTASAVAFAAYGGYGTYTYSISVNNSGGTINSSTGAYTSGATPSVTDTVRVIDQYGNSATASVAVI